MNVHLVLIIDPHLLPARRRRCDGRIIAKRPQYKRRYLVSELLQLAQRVLMGEKDVCHHPGPFHGLHFGAVGEGSEPSNSFCW